MRRSTIRKGLTQKEMAERFNISVKTVKKYTAEPREQYEQTAADRRRQAYELRSQGLKWQQVADKMGCSYHGAVALYRRYVALDMPQNSL
ncbi:TPA: response regulator transcription factor [Staphylococcus aureus]|jgi:orotate phosphoribosyltransferase-like protein|uniref:plasmid replication protein n=1 Tax=Enterobacteriaceae TaxID=543 RepID=UPI001410D0EC|nr:plasmid replication protein [Klebsiella pneumoniae]EDH3025127.1 plasmid replication protein [Salmonella enterica]EFL7054919.1 response regulator transcription factor [Escherichia coli]EJB3497284.1 response regulator transcription factor [Salmonella enterica subsp. enterica]HCD1325208.1 response regulator transcription factor [Klebsiella pneumoniae subsp. pneumoniae]HDE8068350.1 response regulator transcription factor [Staphylococcus aureus]